MDSRSTSKIRVFLSQKAVLPCGVQPAILAVVDGKIREIIQGTSESEIQYIEKNYPGVELEDFGSSVLMPGIVDSHVHVNEPGRTEWEGFYTATKAAAAGGVTTIADMPLNSIPPTTTVNHLRTKAREAHGKIYVDVAFWGGVIPGNQKELRPLVEAGVVGFKCFLCPSGVDEFPHVNEKDVEDALAELKSTKSLLAFHAECESKSASITPKGDPALYETFLRSRPGDMEKNAIDMVCQWCKTFDVRCHIVHVSNAEALDLIEDAKNMNAPLTVETCYHYLVLSAEEVPNGATEFKCCPPIRNKANQDKLWRGLEAGMIDMIVSDHSPCVKELKTCGDFLAAWGGISSLQFGLSLLWTAGRTRNLDLNQMSSLLSERPAKLCGLDNRKGVLSVGMDADFVIWDPEKTFKVEEDHILYKNKLSPYIGKTLYGKVLATVLRGEYIYKNEKLCDKPIGNLLLKKDLIS